MQESVKFNKELKEAIKSSVKTLAKAVKSTLGPEGTNTLVLNPVAMPLIVNDGVTVAKSLVQSLIDNEPKSLTTKITQILNTVPTTTEQSAGDSTSTSVTLLESIILGGLKYIESDYSPINLVKGIELATKDVLEKLEEKSIPVLQDKDLLMQVSSISANNDQELGKIISDIFLEVGIDGQIEVKNSKTKETHYDLVKGVSYDTGYESNLLVNTKNSSVEYENAKLLIYEGKLDSLVELKDIVTTLNSEGQAFIVIADEFSPEIINLFTNNKLNNGFKLCAMRSPGMGSEKEGNLDDIAFLTGASIISKRLGNALEDVTIDSLGDIDFVKVFENSFNIVCNTVSEEETKNKIAELKTKKEQAEEDYEKEEITTRIAKLSKGVAVLYVGGGSPMEVMERTYRIEDAINATRSSLEEGILPGGGITLLKIADSLEVPTLENESQEVGYKVLLEALKSPIETICFNADVGSDIVVDRVLKSEHFNFGFDAKTKKYSDLVEVGVIDPKKGVRAALTNASSTAQMILTLNCAII